VLGLFLLVVFWELAFEMRLVDPVLLPSPAQSFKAFWHGLEEGSLWADLRRTVARTGISFAIALVIAVPLGILLGSSDKVYRALEFPIDFFRSTPASAMFPLFLILFGSGESTKIAVAAFGAALAILFATAYGVMNARKQRQLAARVMGASRLQVLSDVTIWESLPQTFVGMRSGVSLALVIVIVAEMFIGSTDGLGQRILKSQMVFDMPDMYASIFAAGALGYLLNLLFIVAERRFVHWGGK
jgi:NitT/TauT family transport system permease protein